MDSAKRACLAFIIGWAVNQDYRSVYDFGAGKFCVFTSSGSGAPDKPCGELSRC